MTDAPVDAPSVADADFVTFVRAHSTTLHRTAYLMTGSREQAEDVVQTALTRIYASWSRRDAWEQPVAYARRVVTNVVLSSAGRRWWGERPTERLPEGIGEDVTNAVVERDRLRRALLSLPVRQRTAVVLRHYLDLSEADAASSMEVPVNTLKSLTRRGLETLRATLAEVQP